MNSLNFLELRPSTIIDLIFQHLTGNEVLSVTLVHPSWNEYLSHYSLICWKDILVHPEPNNELNHLINSSRRYQHLKAVNISSIVSEVGKIIQKPGRKWKSVEIYRTILSTRSQLQDILVASAKTLEKLSLNFLTCKTKPDEGKSTPSFNFPRLKHLQISSHYINHYIEQIPWFNHMFSSAPQLETLKLVNSCDSHMKELILNCPKLRKFSIAGRFQDINFFDVSRFEKLIINGFRVAYDQSQEDREMLE